MRPKARLFLGCLVAAVALGACSSTKPRQGVAEGSASAAAGGSAGAPPEAAKSASSSSLSAGDRPHLTTILVSAHVGSVIARREGQAWVISGAGGCSVPSARIERALDNLSGLKAIPTTEAVPDGAAFRLQISLLVREKRAVHLEIADHDARGHLTRLDDDSMVRIQGLDTKLWSAQPADWCDGS